MQINRKEQEANYFSAFRQEQVLPIQALMADRASCLQNSTISELEEIQVRILIFGIYYCP